ncbi:MAG: acetylornithine/succinylornithine family transaminase, partial [Candidatus Latescibacteria bacterium]|nr:acetylornithine/succinylornithine family transaminase [Candidatus Latescibacterota bacterium]
MNRTDSARERLDRRHFPMYKRYPVTLVEGKGSRVRDDEGREYVDALAGIAVNALGHAHPDVVAALSEQAARLMHVTNLYYTIPQADLAERLTSATGMDRVFFTNSGTEAVEGALKLARRHAGKNGRGPRIVSFQGCFHGRSMGAIATHTAAQRASFEPLAPEFVQLPFGDLPALEPVLDEATAAVILEPVQGEGGLRVVPDSFLRELRRLCDEREALLILDEIQCGVGRTGRFCAFEHAGIRPDVLVMAKGLGGGFPIGAVLARDAVASAFEPGDHGTTFGGNPLACAVADTVLRIVLEEDLPRRAADLGARAVQRLRAAAADHPAIREVRGRGLMIGIELAWEGKELVLDMMRRGVLANCTSGNVIRLVPPL